MFKTGVHKNWICWMSPESHLGQLMFKKQITKLSGVKHLLIYTKASLNYIFSSIPSWLEVTIGEPNFKQSPGKTVPMQALEAI